ncbi:hypothetical protein GCM10027341_48610 [Spirosoma knui]
MYAQSISTVATGLNFPFGVAVDGAGNIYIADMNNHRIRKVTASTGVATTVAGNGTQGFAGDGGPATAALLNTPRGVAVDGAGNIYIAEVNNHRIRKVTASTGVISTVAGNGLAGFAGDGSAATSARLNLPFGVAVDGVGNIYIADSENSCIRKVTVATGVISTVAGTGGRAGAAGDGGLATSAQLFYPNGVAVDGAGNIYIADYYRIRKVTASTGVISTVAGNGEQGFAGDEGAATSAQLNFAAGVAVDGAANLYISDYFNQRIRKVTASTGIISTVAGTGTAGYSGDGGPATAAQISDPTGVAVDGAANLYFCDGNSRIRRVGTVNTSPSVASVIPAQTATLGEVFSYTLPANAFTDAQTPNSLTYSVILNPANGLVYSPTTNVISGTPIETEVSSVTVVATDPGSLSVSQIFTITTRCPDLPATISGNLTVCTGQSTTLTASGGTTYLWNTGDNTEAISATAGTYSVTVTSNGCSATAIATVIADAPVVATLTPSSGTLSCATTSLTLTAGGGSSYSFSAGATPVGSGNMAVVDVAGPYSVTVAHANGCSAVASTTIESRTAVISISNPATAEGMVGKPFSQSFTASGGTSPYNYSLANDSRPPGLDLDNTGLLSGTLTQAGTFTLTAKVSDATGCSAVSEAYVLTVNDPTPTLAGLATSPETVCVGTVATFTATVGNVTGNYSYTLSNSSASLSGTATSSAFSQSVVAAGSGSQNYTLTVESNGQLASTSVNLTVGSHPDYQPLVDLYNATNGPDWREKSGWLQGCDPCTSNGGNAWYGVTCESGRVTGLNLFNNQLSGTIPSSMSALSSLQRLSLASNQLSGYIPASLSALTDLQVLRLGSNALSGSIPSNLGALSDLQELSLASNLLSGSIPPDLGALTNLQELDLSSNRLTGSIPLSLGALSNLQLLSLTGNRLSGNIPASLGALTSLQYLYLQNNLLTGSIPSSLSVLTSLKQLYLNNNQLSGCWPASLSALCGVPSKSFTGNPGLPGGGSAVAFSAFCASGQGSDVVTAYSSSTTATVGSVVTLSAGAANAYSWTAPAGASISLPATSSVVSATLTQVGVQTFTVVVDNGSNCIQTATVSVNVSYPVPTIAGLGANPGTVCLGSVATFTATVGSVTGSYNYTLSNGSASLSGMANTTAFSQNLTATGSGVQTFTLTVERNGQQSIATTNLTVNITPVASLTNSGPLSLTNASVILAATVGQGYSYSFSQGATQLSQPNTARVTTAGVYSVTITTTEGCSATASTTVRGGNNPTVCRGGTAVINVVVEGDPVKYEWYKNSLTTPKIMETPQLFRGTATSSLTIINAQTNTQGDFYLKVTDRSGTITLYGPYRLTVDASCRAREIAELETSLQVELAPNPIQQDRLRAMVRGAEGRSLQVDLIDLSGKPIHQQHWKQADKQQLIEWDMQGQVNGVYILQVVSEAGKGLPVQRQNVKVIKP